MTIISDIDGVLASFESAWRPFLNKLSGKDIKDPPGWVPDIWDWDVRDYGRETVSGAWKLIAHDDKFWTTLKPLPGAYEALRQLDRLAGSHQVYFLTSRIGKGVQKQTCKWLYDNGCNFPNVLIVSKWQDKIAILDALKADFFADDKLETMQAWHSHAYRNGIKIPNSYLIDTPYNREGRTVKGMKVAANVEDALKQAGLWV